MSKKTTSERRSSALKRIRGIDGKVLHEGRERSVKALVERCAREGRSLRGADLSGLDLMHLDLRGGDFREARLDGAQLHGSRLDDATFANATLRGVSAMGVHAEAADFSGADLSPLPSSDEEGRDVTTSFSGAVLTFADFTAAREIEVDFSRAAMSSTTHVDAVCRKSKYDDAHLHNADWVRARIVGCSFANARMSPRMKTDPAHLPARTKDAFIVGNDYRGAEFGCGNHGFVLDRAIGGKLRLASIGAIASGLFVGTAMIPFDIEDFLGKTIGQTATFVLAASAITWIKDPIEDMFRETAMEWLAEAGMRTRAFLSELCRRGESVVNLAVAMLNKRHADFVQQCVLARHEGLAARFAAAAKGEYEIVVCDREHLAEALARLTEALAGKAKLRRPVILARGGRGCEEAPRGIVISPDGGIEAIWDADASGRIRRKAWGAGGSGASVRRGEPPEADRLAVVRGFARAITKEHALADFDIDETTHIVREGRDGSVVVLRSRDGRLDNRLGPAIVTPRNERLYFRNATPCDENGKRKERAAGRDAPPERAPRGMRS